MLRRAIALLVLSVVALSICGCNTAKGLKDDVVFIGDKTAEILDKSETVN